jgi:hypothetical protein
MVAMGKHTNDSETAPPTVEELEEELAADPSNIEIQEDLANALFNRYYYEGGSEQDLDRLKRFLAEAPEDRALFARAYVAWVNHEYNDAVEKLHECAIQTSEASDEPLTSDELWSWIDPFLDDPPKGLWERLAEGFSHAWADSAVVLTLRGLAEDSSAIAVDYFCRL